MTTRDLHEGRPSRWGGLRRGSRGQVLEGGRGGGGGRARVRGDGDSLTASGPGFPIEAAGTGRPPPGRQEG